MKREDPLVAIEDVRKRLGAPRVNISVLWTVVVQLAADLTYAMAQIDGLRHQLQTERNLRTGIDPVGGSDYAAPSSDDQESLW